MSLRHRCHQRTRYAPIALALIALGLAAQPQVAQARSSLATLIGLGTQGGTASFATGINDSGQVIGGTEYGDYTVASAFVYSSGVTTALAGLGGSQTYANAINNAGQIVGQARAPGGTQFHAVVFDGSAAVDNNPNFGAYGSTLNGVNGSGQFAGYVQTGPSSFSAYFGSINGVTVIPSLVGSGNSFAYAINDAGLVVGGSDAYPVAGGTYMHAFVRNTDGTMQDLGALNGPENYSYGLAINNAGQVVGTSGFGADNASNHAFSFAQGVMNDLGTLGGANSDANAVNARGWIVGDAGTAAGTTHAVLWKDGLAYDLNTVAPAGWTLTYAAGINARGQIVGTGTHDGHDEAFVLTPKASWLGASGRWDDATGWSLGAFGALGQTPDALHDVAIAPSASATVLGSADAKVNSLAISGATDTIVTFNLNDGRTSTAAGASVGANAVLTGSGQLDGPLTVLPGGVLQVGGGQTMLLGGGPVTIQGVARVYGGGGTANLSATAPMTVAAGGQMNLQGANLDLRAGLTVQGQMNAGAGGNNVAGAVTVAPAGRVVLSGNSGTSFYDAVEVQAGAEFRVSAGASATFFGPVTQRTGALFTGTGGKYYEGGLSVGASPGLGIDAGSVTFGDGNFYFAEIGGVTACTAACATDEAMKNASYDKYIVAGHLALGGTLRLVSWNGFVAQAGQSFDLLDWGSASGSFAAIDSSALQLAAGTALDLSRLYTSGEIAVVAVPEPQIWALMAGGLLAIGLRLQHRRARA